jgi:hypothetical protein
VKKLNIRLKDGLDLCDIINRNRKEIIDYKRIRKENKMENLKNEFDVDEK